MDFIIPHVCMTRKLHSGSASVPLARNKRDACTTIGDPICLILSFYATPCDSKLAIRLHGCYAIAGDRYVIEARSASISRIQSDLPSSADLMVSRMSLG